MFRQTRQTVYGVSESRQTGFTAICGSILMTSIFLNSYDCWLGFRKQIFVKKVYNIMLNAPSITRWLDGSKDRSRPSANNSEFESQLQLYFLLCFSSMLLVILK